MLDSSRHARVVRDYLWGDIGTYCAYALHQKENAARVIDERQQVMRQIESYVSVLPVAEQLKLPTLGMFKIFSLETHWDCRASDVVVRSFLRGILSNEETDDDAVEERPDWNASSYTQLTELLAQRSSVSAAFLNILIPKEDENRDRVNQMVSEICEWLEDQQGFFDVVYVLFSRSRLWAPSIQDLLESDLEAFILDRARVSYHQVNTCFVLSGRQLSVVIPHVLSERRS